MSPDVTIHISVGSGVRSPRGSIPDRCLRRRRPFHWRSPTSRRVARGPLLHRSPCRVIRGDRGTAASGGRTCAAPMAIEQLLAVSPLSAPAPQALGSLGGQTGGAPGGQTGGAPRAAIS